MVFFKCFKNNTITILSKDGESQDKGTTLPLHTPLTGPKALDLPEKDNSMHIESWTEEVSWEVTDFGRSRSNERERVSDILILNSSHRARNNPTTSFELLGDRIHNGIVTWSSNLPTTGEFVFLELYWEWLEDVLSRAKDILTGVGLYNAVFASLFSYDRHPPVIRAFLEHWCSATNTLHTSQGELSISLWDLHKIGGLPINEKFYDEVVPCVEEFSHRNSRGLLSMPASCRYLFFAYHKLSQEARCRSGVKVTSWIQFWYRGMTKYKRPQKKNGRNKTTKPKGDSDPSGAIGAARRRTSAEHKVFDELGIASEHMEESYLAAFLACWLCRFVFPKDDINLIRPGVFKVASKMATGELFSLAVPVLANIYDGLSEISDSANPEDCAAVLPFHYVYGWLGEYFCTHFLSSTSDKSAPLMTKYSGALSAKSLDDSQAQALFRHCKSFRMDRLARVASRRRKLIDDSHLRFSDLVYLICLRSGYVTLRQENRYIVQPYSPYRFSRQFGFVQHVPNNLEGDTRPWSLSSVYLHWASCIRANTNSLITMPARSEFKSNPVTCAYVSWWSKVHCFHSVRATSDPNSSHLQGNTPVEDRPLSPVRPAPIDCASAAPLKAGPEPRFLDLSTCLHVLLNAPTILKKTGTKSIHMRINLS